MKLLKEIHETDVLGIESKKAERYDVRRAARAIVIDDQENVLLMEMTTHGIHILPGGEIDDGEDIEKALLREVKEETGYEAEILSEIGVTIEYRDREEDMRINFAYLVRVVGEQGFCKLEEYEKEAGLEVRWFALQEAEKLIKSDQSESYRQKFFKFRDIVLMEEAKKIIKEL